MLSARAQQLYREGLGLQQQGRLSEAAAKLAQVRAQAPSDVAGWHQGGMVALLAGQLTEAAKLLERALQLQPHSLPTAYGLGVARVAMGDLAGAESLLRRVVAAKPNEAEAWHYLALALLLSGRSAEALTMRRKVVALNPSFAPGWEELGTLLSTYGSSTEALACYDRALRLSPNLVGARFGRAIMLFRTFQVPQAVEEMAAVLARQPQRHDVRSYRLLAMNHLDGCTREAMWAEHLAFQKTLPSAPPVRWRQAAEPDRRLRVAFLSPDFREHSVAYFIEPILRHLDRGAFEIVLYHDNVVVDAVSERLRALADVWRNFAGRAHAAVEAEIRADAPDLLVDLVGHAGENRLALLARRLAPVQLTYLGYPNTTGLREMDYRMVDEWTDPPGDGEAFYSEKLVRFAPTAWAFGPPASAPEPVPPPCLTQGHFTFGSFNSLTKLTDRTLSLWTRLLTEVPGSQLLLKAGALEEPAVREPLLRRLAAAGLPVERVQLLGHTPDKASHLACYNRVDLALDMFPYHGTTTTCEALWMGVPMVTLAGDRHASRVGISLLTAVGHPEWIAHTPDDYVRIAATLARDPARLAESRRTLRAEMRRSALMDHAGQAARFGSALRECWRRWCQPADSAPAALELTATCYSP